MKKNLMKEKLRAGKPVYGVSVMIPSPQIVEMVAAAGFDWVLLDCEHGTLTLESVELMAMAAEACGITAIARPMTRSPEHILQVLDRGVMGVQVPHVNTAAEAREVLAAVKFHPEGKRSLAAGTRAAVYDSHGALSEYVKAANEATLVAIQLEDKEAIQNIDELLAVEGIDVFFIGPSDLSQ
jgi:4-hydroxy-2-oxoheptanedioate aldolase